LGGSERIVSSVFLRAVLTAPIKEDGEANRAIVYDRKWGTIVFLAQVQYVVAVRFEVWAKSPKRPRILIRKNWALLWISMGINHSEDAVEQKERLTLRQGFHAKQK
jgi:hypothetical protein